MLVLWPAFVTKKTFFMVQTTIENIGELPSVSDKFFLIAGIVYKNTSKEFAILG